MIVIPSAGRSSRFKQAGIETPKFLLPLGGVTMFDHVLEGFSRYAGSEDFLVIARNTPEEIRFFEDRLRAHGIRDFEVVALDNSGLGMFADVCQGLRQTSLSLSQPILIHPADIIRPGFQMPAPHGKKLSMDFEHNLRGLGCYHLASAHDFLMSYERSRMPGTRAKISERAMEVLEFTRFLKNLAFKGYGFDKRTIPAAEVIHTGNPAQYMKALQHYLQEDPQFPFAVNDPLLFTNDPRGVQTRDKIIGLWLDAIVQKHGTDHGAENYAPTILAHARQAAQTLGDHHMAPALRAHILNELSEAVQSQLPLAQDLENIAHPERHAHGFDAKSAYPHSSKIKNIQSLFAFLSSPYSDEGSLAFLNAQSAFPQEIPEAKSLYRFFWALETQQRTQILSEILEVDTKPDLVFKMGLHTQGKNLLADFLPPAKEKSNAKIFGERFAMAIGKATTQEELAFLFSHMLHAVHKDKTQPPSADPDIRFGHRLTAFLVAIGGAKLAQGAHSFSQTPDAWKIGLAQSKSQAGPMRRVNFLKKAASLPHEIATGIARIGKRLGTGTYIDTKEVIFTPEFLALNPAMADEQSRDGLVLQLLKEGSGKLSSRVFDLTIRTFKEIAATDAEAHQSLSGLIPIFEHKAKMIREETDLNCIAVKARIAEKLIDGVTVKRGRLTAHFATAGVFRHGEDFKVSRKILGVHFNLMPENTPQERALKSTVAETIFTAELFTISSGKPFNHDQHGENQGIQIYVEASGNTRAHIGNFDDGAIILEPPTEKQKKLFANIIMDAMANSAINGFNPVSSLKHTFSKAQKAAELSGPDNADDLSYVDAMIEAIVSLGDYTGHMSTPAIIRSLRTVYNAKSIAPDIAETFSARFSAIQSIGENPFDTLENQRRQMFYPPPTAQTICFTSRANRAMGRALLAVAPRLLQSSALPHILGNNEIIIPAGYNDRSFG